MSDHENSSSGIFIKQQPEHLGPIPVRTELAVQSADPPGQRKIGWSAVCMWGTDIHIWPDGHTGVFRDLPDLEQYLTDERLLTTRDALKPGMKLLIQDLFGWSQGIVLFGPQGKPRVLSPNGKILYMIDFVNDRPPAPDGTPAPPRWVCTGSGNLAAIQNLEMFK